jgi:hypothetical protein
MLEPAQLLAWAMSRKYNAEDKPNGINFRTWNLTMLRCFFSFCLLYLSHLSYHNISLVLFLPCYSLISVDGHKIAQSSAQISIFSTK